MEYQEKTFGIFSMVMHYVFKKKKNPKETTESKTI